MKTMKKIAMLFLAVCLVVPCVSIVSHAASGKIQFTDPSTKTGETVEVTCAVKSDNGSAVGAVQVDIKYDTTMLTFSGGDGIDETAPGHLSYSGTGNSSALRFTIKFGVIKEGTTKLEIEDYEAKLSSGEKLECQKGTSTVTIAKGEGTVQAPTPTPTPTADDVKVAVNGVDYTMSSEIPDAEIPEGFQKTSVEYAEGNRNFVKQETSGLYLAYLVDADGNGDFFVYNVTNDTFSPFEQIEISTTSTIVLLADASAIVMPEEYYEVNITVNEYDFPAWQHMEETDSYILYAVNNNGQTSLYKYDATEGTYQRMETPEVVEEEVDDSVIGKAKAYVTEHFTYVLLIAGLVLLFFLVLVIVISVKLHNRNLELDDLYDEYGIDLDDEEPQPMKKEERKAVEFRESVKEKVDEDEDEDEGIELEELEYEDEDDFDLKFEERLEESLEKKEEVNKTMKKEDSFFEDFDFDLIDLDD